MKEIVVDVVGKTLVVGAGDIVTVGGRGNGAGGGSNAGSGIGVVFTTGTGVGLNGLNWGWKSGSDWSEQQLRIEAVESSFRDSEVIPNPQRKPIQPETANPVQCDTPTALALGPEPQFKTATIKASRVKVKNTLAQTGLASLSPTRPSAMTRTRPINPAIENRVSFIGTPP